MRGLLARVMARTLTFERSQESLSGAETLSGRWVAGKLQRGREGHRARCGSSQPPRGAGLAAARAPLRDVTLGQRMPVSRSDRTGSADTRRM